MCQSLHTFSNRICKTVLIKCLLLLLFKKTHPRWKVPLNEFSVGLCLQGPVSRRHTSKSDPRATKRKRSDILWNQSLGPCVILTVAGESKHRALAEGMCAPAVQLKQGSVGPEKDLHCMLSPCTQGFFPHHTLNCLLTLKVSLFSYSLCLYHRIGKRFLEWQRLPFLATFLLTNWDNNSGSQDNSSQFYGDTRGCQGRNAFMHRLRHTAAWDWQQPPRAAYSDVPQRFLYSGAAGALGAAQCLRAVPLYESPQEQNLPSLRETSL